MKINLTIFLILYSGFCSAQTQTEEINITIPSSEVDEQTIFHLNNINGEVNVTGYSGDEIIISGTKSVWRKNSDLETDDLEKVSINRLRDGKHLFVFVEAPNLRAEIEDGKLSYNNPNRHQSRWEDEDRLRYEIILNLKVPEKLMSYISTINGGSVNVENLHSYVKASNVNGDVNLKEVSGEVHARTVNGDIVVDFTQIPVHDLNFNTVNGSIEIFAPKNLSAIVTFQSLHGDLYTNFEEIEFLPNRLTTVNSNGKSRFKINRTNPVKFGSGGPEISLKLLNGNAYIKQRTS